MKLELNNNIIKAIQNKEIDFKSLYTDDGFNDIENEVKAVIENQDIDKISDLLGVTAYYVAKFYNSDLDLNYLRNDLIISEIGFNVKDYEYIKDFAVSCIIEDNKLKLDPASVNNNKLVTEMLQGYNIIFTE